MKKLFWVLLLALCAGFSAHLFAAAEVGQPAPDFSLTDSSGTTHTLSEHKGKFVVLEWVNYDCPFVKKHYSVGNMQNLQKEFTGKGAVWFSINSSAPGKQGNFSAEEINQKIAESGAAPSAYLMDQTGDTGRAYGAKTTPHMFVVDPQGVLIYKGGIDDKPSTDSADIAGSKNYVSAALNEAMAGNAVTNASTDSYGCSVKY